MTTKGRHKIEEEMMLNKAKKRKLNAKQFFECQNVKEARFFSVFPFSA